VTSTRASAVSAHYGRPGLLEAIEAALRSMGKSPAQVEAHELASVDQFHTRGQSATASLAALGRTSPPESGSWTSAAVSAARRARSRSPAAVTSAWSISPRSTAKWDGR
jgi:hypothetical protein